MARATWFKLVICHFAPSPTSEARRCSAAAAAGLRRALRMAAIRLFASCLFIWAKDITFIAGIDTPGSNWKQVCARFRQPIAPDMPASYIHFGMSLGHNNQNWHETLDDRSLEMDRVIAEKIRANPKLIQIALTNIERWLTNPDYSESNR